MLGDRELIERLAAGDREAALAELLRRHGAMVERTARRRVGDPHLAEDIRQSVFLILTHKAALLVREGSIARWLHQTTLLAARDALKIEERRRRRERKAAKTTLRREDEREVELPANFDEALERMPEIYRQAIILRYLEGRNRIEMAEALELKAGAVDARVSRGLELLRRSLAVGSPALSLVMLTQHLKVEAAVAAGTAQAGTFAPSAKALALAKSVTKGFVWLKVKAVVAVLCAAALVGGGSVAALGPWPAHPSIEASEIRKGPLAGLPSAPGAHLARIDALGDNEWLHLGSPAPDPVWGRARGRGWSAKMPAAVDLRGAFLAGLGPNGFVKPDGHTMDDNWFYDLHANRWICVYPGTDTVTFNRQVERKEFDVDDDGQVVDRNGQPIPVNAGIGGAGNVTYDPDRRQFVAQSRCNCNPYLVPPALEEGVMKLQQRGTNRKPCSPWFCDTATGTFERYPVAREALTDEPENGANQLLYIPGLKRYFFAGRQGTAFFDPRLRAWTIVEPKGIKLTGINHGACYDPKRHRIYMGGGYNPDARSPGDNFFVFDLSTSTWSKPNPTGEFPTSMNNNESFFNYDAANDVVLVMESFGRRIFAYDPVTNSWTHQSSSRPEIGSACGSGFYDPTLNAYFCYFAMGGDDRGQMHVYRFRRVAR
jgi:RNA polymerase sigma factor (sigma-70 family)